MKQFFIDVRDLATAYTNLRELGRVEYAIVWLLTFSICLAFVGVGMDKRAYICKILHRGNRE